MAASLEFGSLASMEDRLSMQRVLSTEHQLPLKAVCDGSKSRVRAQRRHPDMLHLGAAASITAGGQAAQKGVIGTEFLQLTKLAQGLPAAG